MNELLRSLLEQRLAPAVVQTDLSAAKTPSYAVARKGERLEGEDIAGRQRLHTSLAVNMRHCAVTEADRREAYRKLHALGDWLDALDAHTLEAGAGRQVCRIETALPALQEAFDDGSAAWSMGVDLIWERNRKDVPYGD